ncbi:MAG TPA: cysteine peptidase family C39 domain-containing protein [Verrucomicrobiae bacterium]|nr:cysteine peptidase family C39 domain-containing protein [Verrucomicrobiae bacterium]
MGEPLWLYRLRTVTGSELLAGLMGFGAGWMQARIVPKLNLSKVGAQLLVPFLLVFGIALPYLKPIFRPLHTSNLREIWQDNVCLQSSFSTCGPASAATVLRNLGGNVSERELAEESFSCSSGTENWYLARALRRRGFMTTFVRDERFRSLPAIAGVRLKQADNSGHFIALLEWQGDRLVTGDPMVGRSTNTLAELREKYDFTGFAMLVRRK